ncbi:MAG: phenylalanine--tRNA ligase subunit beta, partial [Holosporaceae bacterium]|nr:phenylalanine--tRNA ligase subunit beta [Holosporaceae bacterium]
MRFSFNWLKRHLSTDLSIQEIADKLTSIGLEVENIEDPTEIFENFKLVQIESSEKHPNADNLHVCVVKDSDGNKMRIVCGAQNARTGLKTVLALPGAKIPYSGEVLKKSKIRGVESEGMMCSYRELSVQSKDDKIIEIDDKVDLKTPVGEALDYGNGIIDASITPNRGDCFSIMGIARDLAAAGAGNFMAAEKVVCKSSFKFPLRINYDTSAACSQYAPMLAFRVIRGIKNGDSPQWLKSLLKAAEMNSVSAVVDMANWLMKDIGRPLHIYDLNKIKGSLSIRFTRNKESFIDLKENSHVLLQDTLIAADEESPLCLLGIIGSTKAACDEHTTDILIESALFDPIFIARTGMFLNITTDSRAIFERGIDKASCVPGIEAISKLILDNCGGEASEIYVIGKQPSFEQRISLKKEKLHSISGYEVDWNVAKIFLKRLGLQEISSDSENVTFQIPSWRSDLNIEEDLVEEVIRMVGY